MQSDETTETFDLESRDCAYLIGKGGETRARLEKFSGASFSVDNNVVKITGDPRQRDRAKIAMDIVLMQRTGENNTMDVDFLKMRERPDVSTLDIPCMRIGFLLGKKAASLRKIEAKHGVWAVLDEGCNSCTHSTRCRRGGAPCLFRIEFSYIVYSVVS